MKVIFVHKKWLGTIGDVAELLLIREEHNDYISILATQKIDVSGGPFVDANLARKNVVDGEYFVPALIPTSLITGIFDLTKVETSKYGFTGT